MEQREGFLSSFLFFYFFLFFLKLIEEAQEGRVPERPEERKREIGGLRKDHVIT